MEDHVNITKARVRLITAHPFFGHLALTLQSEESNLCPTMGTDGIHLTWNRAWVDSLTLENVVAVIAHEVLHCALAHLWRRGSRDMTKWNWAADMATNDLLVEDKFDLLRGALWSKSFQGMPAEEIYSLLPDPPTGGGGGGKGLLDDHSGWEKAQESSGQPQESLPQIWRERVAQAATAARLQGNLPAGIAELVDKVLRPKLDWRMLLRDMVMSAIKANHRLIPPSKKHLWRGIYLPSMTGERLEIAVAIDTSGSISHDELVEFISEVRGIAEQFADFTVYLFTCDAAVHQRWEIGPYDSWPQSFKGRGGTDFRPVVEAVENEYLSISALVYCTDLYGTFPSYQPDYPVIWVAPESSKSVKVPFGTVIYLERRVNGH